MDVMFSIGDVVESGSVSGDDESACAGSRGRLEIDQSRYHVGEADGVRRAVSQGRRPGVSKITSKRPVRL